MRLDEPSGAAVGSSNQVEKYLARSEIQTSFGEGDLSFVVHQLADDMEALPISGVGAEPVRIWRQISG